MDQSVDLPRAWRRRRWVDLARRAAAASSQSSDDRAGSDMASPSKGSNSGVVWINGKMRWGAERCTNVQCSENFQCSICTVELSTTTFLKKAKIWSVLPAKEEWQAHPFCPWGVAPRGWTSPGATRSTSSLWRRTTTRSPRLTAGWPAGWVVAVGVAVGVAVAVVVVVVVVVVAITFQAFLVNLFKFCQWVHSFLALNLYNFFVIQFFLWFWSA